MLCEHTNEVPEKCPCHSECPCRQEGHSCHSRESVLDTSNASVDGPLIRSLKGSLVEKKASICVHSLEYTTSDTEVTAALVSRGYSVSSTSAIPVNTRDRLSEIDDDGLRSVLSASMRFGGFGEEGFWAHLAGAHPKDAILKFIEMEKKNAREWFTHECLLMSVSDIIVYRADGDSVEGRDLALRLGLARFLDKPILGVFTGRDRHLIDPAIYAVSDLILPLSSTLDESAVCQVMLVLAGRSTTLGGESEDTRREDIAGVGEDVSDEKR